MSQFPGPPLEDPPTSPPHERRGRSWGERGGTTGARAAPGSGDAASLPMCQLAWRGGCSEDARPASEVRRLCGLRDTKRAEGERLARRSSRTDQFKNFSGPASGMAGVRGDDLAGVQRTERSGVNGTPASSSSGPRSRTREGNKARDPRSRERSRCRHPRRRSRPDLAVRHRDEGAALIAAFASEPARRLRHSPARSRAPTSAGDGGEPA